MSWSKVKHVIFATPAARTRQFLCRLRRANDALDKVSGLYLPIFSRALCNRTSLSGTLSWSQVKHVIFAPPAARTMQFLCRLRRANDALDKVRGLHLPIFIVLYFINGELTSYTCHDCSCSTSFFVPCRITFFFFHSHSQVIRTSTTVQSPD